MNQYHLLGGRGKIFLLPERTHIRNSVIRECFDTHPPYKGTVNFGTRIVVEAINLITLTSRLAHRAMYLLCCDYSQWMLLLLLCVVVAVVVHVVVVLLRLLLLLLLLCDCCSMLLLLLLLLFHVVVVVCLELHKMLNIS